MRKTVFFYILVFLLSHATAFKAQEISFDFEDGTYQYWTCIDADGDEDCWWLIGEQWELTGHNDSHYFVISASYDSPDNYFLAPDKDHYSKISFWACADSVYFEEHFGVAVSTTDPYPADNYTTIQEWTITADGDSKTQSKWHEYTADLSAYAGQEIWLAIRHFNCKQHILYLDDITLTYDMLGVEEHNAVGSFMLYPNPVKDKLMVDNEQTVSHYEIYTLLGEKATSRKVNTNRFEVNTSELPTGVYFIRLHSEGLVETKRFVKE